MGDLVLAEALTAGQVELAGPVTRRTMVEVVGLLDRAGADRILLDGALDRRSSGAPGVADAVVLSAGAVLGASPESIAARLAHHVGLLRLPGLRLQSRTPFARPRSSRPKPRRSSTRTANCTSSAPARSRNPRRSLTPSRSALLRSGSAPQ
jgi:hypothetical protein